MRSSDPLAASLRSHLDAVLTAEEPGLIALRRDLHAHPELGRGEVRTTSVLHDRLTAGGLSPRMLPNGVGLVCDVGPASGRTVALRADIDALPLPDEKLVPYRSTRPGVCHACGHDAHAAMLVGAGLALHRWGGELPGRVRLVFQPAEESTPGGAIDAVKAGVLEGVERILALHCDPRVEVGRLGVRVGAITAAADTVEVRLTGPGGHTARPHLTSDLVFALSKLVTDLPAGLSRLVDPRSGLSLVWGMISAGSAPNAIPQSGVARGTMRMLDPSVQDTAAGLLQSLIESTVAPYGARAELVYARGVPAVVNDAASTGLLAAAAEAGLGPDSTEPTPQSLGGEDFAYYLEHVPGALARLGVRTPGSTGVPADLHSGTFDIDERALACGVRVLVHAATAALTTDVQAQSP